MSARELLTECLEALTHDAAQRTFAGGVRMSQLAIKLRAHLAAPRPEPVAWMYVNSEGECEQIEYGTEAIDDDSITLLYAAPPAAAPEPVRHPGYVIGNHWLETAYSRICAGDAEANVLRDYGLIREEAFTIGVEHLRQEIKRLREALKKYGRHLDDCALTLGGYQCTCGFNQQEVPR